MKTIYTTQLPQTLIRENEEDASLIISAKYNDEAHIAAEPSDLAEVIQFHKDARACKIVILAETSAEALTAIDARCDFILDGQEYSLAPKGKKMTFPEIQLLKLRFAGEAEADAIARIYITHMIRKHGYAITADEINAELLKTGATFSESTLTLATRAPKAIEKRVEEALSITDYTNIEVRTVKSGDEVDVDAMRAEAGVFINALPTGYKKTEKAIELMEKADRAAYLSHRRTITARDIANATHYEHIKVGDEHNIKSLKVVVNSLAKGHIQEFLNCDKLDVLVIDEVAQVLRHIATGSFDGKNDRATVYYKLKEQVKRAKTVYCADADTNQAVIDFIRSCRGRDEKIVLFKAEERKLDVTAIIDDYAATEARALTEAKNGRAFIAADNAKFVAKHARKLGGDALGLTADNIMGYEDLIANPEKLMEHGSLLFSPAITSSVSIVNGGYTGHYGLFSGNITATDAVQMLRRERTAGTFTVAAKSHDDILLDDAGEILARNNSDCNEFDMFAADIEANDNYIRNNITTAIATALRLAGFNLEIQKTNNTEEQEQAKETKKQATAEYNAWKIEALFNATPATKGEIKKAREAGETTQYIAISKERADIERTMGTSNITKEDIKDGWKEGGLMKHVRNIEIAMMNQREAATKTYNEKKKVKASRDRFDYAEHNRLINLIFDTLGINKEDFKGEFTTDDMNKLGDILHDNRNSFNKLSFKKKIGKNKPARFTMTGKEILRELGLSADKGKVARKDGKTTRVFSITVASAERMTRYINNRKQNNLTH